MSASDYAKLRLQLIEILNKYYKNILYLFDPVKNNIITLSSEQGLNYQITELYKDLADSLSHEGDAYEELSEEQKSVLNSLEILKNLLNSPNDTITKLNSIFDFKIPQFNFNSIKNIDYPENKDNLSIHLCLWHHEISDITGEVVELPKEDGIRDVSNRVVYNDQDASFYVKIVDCGKGLTEEELKKRYFKHSTLHSNPELQRTATLYFSNKNKSSEEEDDWLNNTVYLNKNTFNAETGDYDREFIPVVVSNFELADNTVDVKKIRVYIDNQLYFKWFAKIKIKYLGPNNVKGIVDNSLYNILELPPFDIDDYAINQDEDPEIANDKQNLSVYIDIIDERPAR